jgi:Nif-specific regulatory protein
MLSHVLPFNYQKLYMQNDPTPMIQPSAVVISPPTPQYDAHSSAPMTKKTLQELEKEAILQALSDSHGIQTKAARILGMSARQIGYKIKQYGIEI